MKAFAIRRAFLFALLVLLVGSVSAFSTLSSPKRTRRAAAFGVISGNSQESIRNLGSPPVSRAYGRSLIKVWAQESDDEDDEDDDDDDYAREVEEPLSKGIDSVSWLPSTVGATGGEEGSAEGTAEELPLFPLGGIVYTPNSEHILNIFEPRYREMYNNILMNGSKKFVVSMSHPTEPGRFAQTGVLFELEDLKEVSEQTGDKIKYICSHKVTGRVKIHRILNPEAWENRETYLRVEGTISDDSEKDKDKTDDDDEAEESPNDVYGAIAGAAAAAATEGNLKEEKALRDAFDGLVELQHEMEEDVRFTRASSASLAVMPGSGKDGLWQTIRLWQSFIEQRLMARQNELQREFQERLQAFLKKERGLKDEELPSAIGYQDLSPALQKELTELQKRMAIELQPLVLESTLTMQKILEAPDHTGRLKLVRYFIEAEARRLATKKTLKGMFSGKSTTAFDEAIPAEERTFDDDTSVKQDDAQVDSSSLFTDEPDAFQ